MLGSFNSVCGHCGLFRPRCATVNRIALVAPPLPFGIEDATCKQVLCADCRKLLRGRFRLGEKHREKKT